MDGNNGTLPDLPDKAELPIDPEVDLSMRETPGFDLLRDLALRSHEANTEFGLLLIKGASGVSHEIAQGGKRNEVTHAIRITQNFDTTKEYVFFHTHPGFPHQTFSSEFNLIPSFYTNTVSQGMERDIGSSDISEKKRGGYLNIVNEEGITFCVGYEHNLGLESATKYLRAIARTEEDCYADMEVILGAGEGQTFSQRKKWAEATEGEFFNENGIAMYRIVDKFTGKSYTFLSISWDNFPEDIDLSDLAFGNGLDTIAEQLKIPNHNITNSNLSDVLKEESKLLELTGEQEIILRIKETEPKVLRIDPTHLTNPTPNPKIN